MELIIVRHTTPDVPKSICYGQTDVPLCTSFEKEASCVVGYLRNLNFDAVYSSPSSRAVRLAAYCGFRDAIVDRRLMELNFGRWEMQDWSKIDDPELEYWFSDYFRYPAGGGEAFNDLVTRVTSFIVEKSRLLPLSARVLIFGHKGTQMAAGMAAGIFTQANVFKQDLPCGGVLQISWV